MRQGILTTFRQEIHIHWGMGLVFGLLSVMCCCCMDLCADDDGNHSSEQHSKHVVCHHHQNATRDVSSFRKDVSSATDFSPICQTLFPAFDLSDSISVLEVPPSQSDEPTQTDLILRSSRLLI